MNLYLFTVLLFAFTLPLTAQIQSQLDNGTSPLELFANGVPADSLYGKIYQGGYIFYLDTMDILPDADGLVVLPYDLDVQGVFRLNWGCEGIDTQVPNAFNLNQPSAQIGTGAENTLLFVTDACANADDAAVLCYNLDANGYDDWFLPSINELIAMDRTVGNLAPGNRKNIANFFLIQNTFYWSSTEFNASLARRHNFTLGTSNSKNKGDTDRFPTRVRAARSFTAPPPPVPTMSQWALALFCLVIINLGVVYIYGLKKEYFA